MPVVSDGSYTYAARIFRQEPIVCVVETPHRIHTIAEHEVFFLNPFLDGLILPDLGRKEDDAAAVSTAIMVMQMTR